MVESTACRDEDLLAIYAHGGQGATAAFEQLVAAHGGMVYQTCLRVLGRREAAEDAAQAVFMVLAQRAGEVRGEVGAFLHGVAFNVSRRAREAEGVRRNRERESVRMAVQPQNPAEFCDPAWDEVRPQLDDAIRSLPASQRTALILHYLEGMSHSQVARTMQVTEGAVASYVNRATSRLRERLASRGVTLSATVLLAMLGSKAGPAACPTFLLSSAARLAGSVTAKQTLGIALGLKIAAWVSAAVVGIAAVSLVTLRQKEPTPATPAAPTPPPALTPAAAGAPKLETTAGAALFVRDFDAVPANETTPNPLVCLPQAGRELTAIVSLPWSAATGSWKPEVHIEYYCAAPQDDPAACLYTIPKDIEVRIRIRSERPGRWELTQNPVERRFPQEFFATDYLEVGPEWREVTLRSDDIAPYRQEGHTRDFVPGVRINRFGIYGHGTGKLWVDRFTVGSRASGETPPNGRR